MDKIKVVCGTIAFSGEKFALVQERAPNVYGKWNYPCGKLELRESLFNAAERETLEETGLIVKLDGLIGIYEHNRNGNNTIKFVFKAAVTGGELRPQESELIDAKWFTYSRFFKLPKHTLRLPDMRKIIRDCKEGKLIPLDRINVDFVRLMRK